MKYLLKLSCCLLAISSSFSIQAEQTCHPFSVNTCTLPFPSNFYTDSDVSSPTGLQVDLKGTMFSQAAEDKISNLTSPQVFSGANGFSASAPIMIELPSAFDDSSIPVEGGQTVLVFDQTTAQRVAIRTQRFAYAQDDRFAEKAEIIEIFPRTRFEYGHHYVAVVTNQLRTAAGENFVAHENVSQLISGQADWSGAGRMSTSLNNLTAYGISPQEVVTFVEFTIGDEATNNDPLFSLMDQVAELEHPVRNLKTQQINVWPYAASVKGQIKLSEFRNPIDGRINFHQETQPTEYWADFILMLPIASKHGAAPVSVYGHGLGATKESMLLTVAYPNAEKGVATIVIDQPNHGSRVGVDGGDIKSLLTPERFTRVSGMMTQSSLDMMSVMKALQTSLAGLDVAPAKNNWWNRLWYSGGINTPDIDSSNIIYQGTSMGGVLGTSFVATADDLKAAFVQVTGVGLSNILSHSVLFKSFGFENMIPDNATSGEAALFIHALQQEVDHGDAINFAHYIRNPIHGRQSRGLIVQYGLGDKVVFNRSTEVLAELAELPLITPAIQDINHLDQSNQYQDNYGLVQTKPLLPTAGLLDHLLGHASFIRIDSIQAMKIWIDDMFE